jgi:uroporphyrin-III C-methyltransferase
MTAATGTVYLVGAGPGAADLLTLRAARLLREADIVFHDALVNPEVLAIAARAAKVAVGKRCGRHSTAQRFINKRLVDAARKHGVVVRLKGGDPMIFGRAQEEIDALRAAGVRFEVVPGVTAALAAAAELGTSLTRRGVSRNVVFATPRVGEGHTPSDWVAPLAHADTAVIYMGAGEAEALAAALLAQGRPASLPVVAVENASLPGSRTIATSLGGLSALAAEAFTGPVILLLGEIFAAGAEADHVRRNFLAASAAYLFETAGRRVAAR